MAPNALIEIVNVGFQYAGAEKVALKNISLSIQKGEVIAIVGRDGFDDALDRLVMQRAGQLAEVLDQRA